MEQNNLLLVEVRRKDPLIRINNDGLLLLIESF